MELKEAYELVVKDIESSMDLPLKGSKDFFKGLTFAIKWVQDRNKALAKIDNNLVSDSDCDPNLEKIEDGHYRLKLTDKERERI